MSEVQHLHFPDAALVLGEDAALPLVRPNDQQGLDVFLPACATAADLYSLQAELALMFGVETVTVYLVHGMPEHRIVGDWA
jgi:hypothetical protein